MSGQPATPYDGLYKQLFSHPQMVEALLRGFVREDWVAQLDFGTLEKPNGQYVSDELLQRADDVIWRVRLNLPDGRSEWLYLYLLIEFQSRADPWMALRMLTYVCLLYQDLIKSGQIARGRKLPPVLPLVLYNGQPRWRPTRELAHLIAAPVGLARWRPSFRYHLLDEGRVADEELRRLSGNLLALLIRLGNTPEAPAISVATRELVQHLKGPQYDSLRRVFVVFYNRIILRKLNPGEPIEEFTDLQEIDSMLAERIEQWTRRWMQEGRQEGAAKTLEHLLSLRFGELPDWAAARLGRATEAELEQWTEAVLSADSLEGVLGKPE
ncbi:transposase [Pseudothauera nasutitermitis]|uniref:Transposase n=1 Tax=Pseudothauera nasutitermitis TaxID=2565930 RepID=A0A4S4B3B2_9RHOO|nr:Rpn family recombination-promoting nuclease/putative transposase [Pseudothauera nasutitermitis]THF67089.1 transposase [Pseudothauera nasutitermitis]